MLAAKTFLEQAATTNLPEFLKALSEVLVQITNSSVARTAAGLQLKNHLTSKDATLSVQYQQRWLTIPEDIREYIKKNVGNLLNFLQRFSISNDIFIIPVSVQILASLGTENTRPSSAAQCVAYVAVAELPAGQWNYLIATLVSKVVTETSTETEREAALEAIGKSKYCLL